MGIKSIITAALLVIMASCLMAPAARAENAAGIPGGLSYDAGMAAAAKDKKFVLVDFYTPWCHSCRDMEKTTFADPGVAALLKTKVVPVKVDASKQSDLAMKYTVLATPTVWLLEPSGAKIAQRTGYMNKDEMKVFLDYALTGAYKKVKFNDYIKSCK